MARYSQKPVDLSQLLQQSSLLSTMQHADLAYQAHDSEGQSDQQAPQQDVRNDQSFHDSPSNEFEQTGAVGHQAISGGVDQ